VIETTDVPRPSVASDPICVPDGRELTVRPIRRSDGPELRELHERTSPETQRQRFLTWHPKLSQREVEWLTNLDHDHREALVAVENGEIAAVARYERRSDGEAEAKLVVRDDYQGKGLGSTMLQRLVLLARARGIHRLLVDTLPDNPRMWAAAHDTGYPCIERRENGIVKLAISLEGRPRPR
jgi:GNAT superfamily N-acetyltransferase